ncbi:hypothetical protein LR066_03810 [candidate division WOR-3 bacterium]|nr:hypothetical protein [candidate division WOR-3 bacterium]
MHKFLIVPMLACVVGVVFLTATHNEECRCQDRHRRHPEWIKDVEVDISDVENGVLIKITSNNPDVVKLIQEYAARYEEKFKDAECTYDCDEGKYRDDACTCDCDDEAKERGPRCR